MSSMFMWRHIYKHQGGRGLIKYIFLSPLLKEKEKGEGADLGRWDCSGEGHFQISLIKWSSGAIGVNSIVLASPRQHVAFNSSLKERMSGGSPEIKASNLIGILLRYLLPSDLEVTSTGWLALYYMLVLSVITSVPEAKSTWSQGLQNSATS